MDILEQIKSDQCDEVELLDYITDNNVEIAIAAAESLMATEPILDIAARDRDRRVRLAALNNPNIGRETLKFLLKDSDVEVAEKAKKILEGK